MKPEPFLVTPQQMNLILMAVEHGFREHERGKNLQGALEGVFALYRVGQPESAMSSTDGAKS